MIDTEQFLAVFRKMNRPAITFSVGAVKFTAGRYNNVTANRPAVIYRVQERLAGRHGVPVHPLVPLRRKKCQTRWSVEHKPAVVEDGPTILTGDFLLQRELPPAIR